MLFRDASYRSEGSLCETRRQHHQDDHDKIVRIPGTDECLDNTVKPYADADGFLRRALALSDSPTAWTGTLYRTAEPKYARKGDRLKGIGSCMYGGRWNPPGMYAVYGSQTPEIAMAEALALYRYYALPVHQAMPRTFFAFRASRFTRLLDLTDGMVRNRLRVSTKRLLQCDWRADAAKGREALTQAIGRAAHRANFQGIIVPSACQHEVANLVFFPTVNGVSTCLETLKTAELTE